MVNPLRNAANGTATPKAGHALTLLTLGCGEEAVAVVTNLAVTAHEPAGSPPIMIRGPVRFEETTIRHCKEVVISLVHCLGHSLGIPPQAHEVCSTNLGAASAQDRSVTVSGFSADAALFVACLSAMVKMPILSGVAVTGHIASLRGDVRMVRHLPAKLRAAATSPIVEAVLFPDPAADDSLAMLTPEEKLAIDEAVHQERGRFRMTAIHNVEEVIRGAFAEPELVLASLRQGYFDMDIKASDLVPGLTVLASDLPNRFWTCLEEAIHGKDPKTLYRLLRARVAHQLSVKTYPGEFGRELYRLLSSVPPGVRHTRLHFPLLSSQEVFSMVQLASPEHLDDLRRFLDAVAGDRFVHTLPVMIDERQAPGLPAANVHLAALVDAIDPDTLCRTVGAGIDAARGLFTLETVTAQDDRECLGVVTAFYIHMLRYYGIGVVTENLDALAADAANLLERAFAQQGGAKAAFSEACAGTRGRLRYILDTLTEYYRADEEEKQRNLAFQKVLTTLEYDEQVALVRAFMEYLGDWLPEDVRSSPPERYVQHAEVLLRAYAQASGRFKQLVRAL